MPAATMLLTTGPALEQHCFQQIRTRMALDHCKWDPQVGDRSALFSQPLFLDSHTWGRLAAWSEAMAGEISAAEQELAYLPELYRALGVPKGLRRVLKLGLGQGFTPSAVRIMRFDFHLTTEGWRVSEVNSKVRVSLAFTFISIAAGEGRSAYFTNRLLSPFDLSPEQASEFPHERNHHSPCQTGRKHCDPHYGASHRRRNFCVPVRTETGTDW